MRSRATLGWMVVLAALGAAGYIVYRSSALRPSEAGGGEGGLSRKPPSDLFSDPAGKDKTSQLTNPISGGGPVSASTAAAPSASISSMTAGPPAVASAAPAAAADIRPQPPATPVPASVSVSTDLRAPPLDLSAATPAPGGAAAWAAPGSSAVPPLQSSSPTAGAILLARDPTLSPNDIFRQEKAEFETLLKRQELVKEIEKKSPVLRRARRIDEGISLQGIIVDSEGRAKGIVNGEVVSEGDTVAEDAKILRITQQEILFQRGGKKFRKRISK